jgi:hypothetical protein
MPLSREELEISMAEEMEELFEAAAAAAATSVSAAAEGQRGSHISAADSTPALTHPLAHQFESESEWYSAPLARIVCTAGFAQLQPAPSATAPRLACHRPAHAVVNGAACEGEGESDAVAEYNGLVDQAAFTRTLPGQGSDVACMELEAALLCSALELCDEDVGVHGRLAELQQHLLQMETE